MFAETWRILSVSEINTERRKRMKKALIFILFLIAVIPLTLTSCFRKAEFSDTLKLSNDRLTLSAIGDIFTLSARVFIDYEELSAEEIKGEIEWISSDVGVAVCNDGEIEVMGYGNCVIRATHVSGVSATCLLSVPNPNPTLIISESELALSNIGRTAQLTATSDKGEDITEKVTWLSSNANIVSCVEGKVTANGYGSCFITATSPTDGKKAVCAVTVGDPTAPYVELRGAENSLLELDVGKSAVLDAVIKNGAGTTVSWKSSDPKVATCERGIVRAVGRGVCAILAMTEKGYTDYVIVSVDTERGKIRNIGERDLRVDLTASENLYTDKALISMDTDPPTDHYTDLLKFAFNNVGRELLYTDASSGRTISRSAIISYRIDTQILADGRIVVQIWLNCVKTYDADGLTGENAAVITSNLYRENDIFCLKNTYKFDVDVGETFTVECQGFTVQTGTGISPRDFYMTFSTITEE